MNRIAVGLHASAVDDTHLGTRWGDLLLRLSGGLQSRHNPTASGNLGSDIPRPAIDNGLLPEPSTSSSSNPLQSSATRSSGLGTNESLQTKAHFEPNDFIDIYSASMDSGRYGHNLESFSMWWDLLHPSHAAATTSDLSWYPTLGTADNSETLFQGVTDGELQQGTTGFSGGLY